MSGRWPRCAWSVVGLGLLLGLGCARGPDSVPTAPLPRHGSTPKDSGGRQASPHGARLGAIEVRVRPIVGEELPPTLKLRLGERRAAIEPQPGAIAILVAPAIAHRERANVLWLQAPNSSRSHYAMQLPVFETPPGGLELGLLPQWSIQTGPYRSGLDLLTEFVRPYSGSVIRRWQMEAVRVAAPPDSFSVDYAGTFLSAVESWNSAMGAPHLIAVPHGAAAEIVTEMVEDGPLAYAEILDRDELRHPLRMRIQMRPAWANGAEKYVRRAWLHELGHVLGLWGHTLDRAHVMNGIIVTADEIHPDEARAARWFWGLPNGSGLAWYRRSAARPAEAPGGIPNVPRAKTSRRGDSSEITPVVIRCEDPMAWRIEASHPSRR